MIGELGDMEPVPTLLVLDDFHGVDGSSEAVDFVGDWPSTDHLGCAWSFRRAEGQRSDSPD